MKKFCHLFIIIFISLFLLILNSLIFTNDLLAHNVENLVNVYNQKGEYIFGTAMGVVKGDMYISQENEKYKIIKVEKSKALAKKIGKINLLENILTETKTPNMTDKKTKLLEFIILIMENHINQVQ